MGTIVRFRGTSHERFSFQAPWHAWHEIRSAPRAVRSFRSYGRKQAQHLCRACGTRAIPPRTGRTANFHTPAPAPDCVPSRCRHGIATAMLKVAPKMSRHRTLEGRTGMHGHSPRRRRRMVLGRVGTRGWGGPIGPHHHKYLKLKKKNLEAGGIDKTIFQGTIKQVATSVEK